MNFNLPVNLDLDRLRDLNLNLQLTPVQTAMLATGIALTVFVVFLVLRFVLEQLARLFRWLFRRKEPLLADRLGSHLDALRPPRNLGEKLDRAFERLAGRSALNLTGAQAAAYLLLAGVSAGTAVYFWLGREGPALAAGLAGMMLTLGFFWVMHWHWRRQVQELLPDTFHLLARSLRAGLTVDQSVALIGSQGQQPLAEEFRRCAEHLKLGLTVPAAFAMTAGRIGLADFDLLVSLVTLHRQTGGNLPLLVDRLATAVRSRNHFRGHVAAVTALGRVSGLFLAIAGPLLLLGYWLLYPEYASRLTDSRQGLTALATAGVLEVVGVTWLLWLLRVDY